MLSGGVQEIQVEQCCQWYIAMELEGKITNLPEQVPYVDIQEGALQSMY